MSKMRELEQDKEAAEYDVQRLGSRLQEVQSTLQATYAELSKSQEETAMWKDKYEKLKKSMIGAIEEAE